MNLPQANSAYVPQKKLFLSDSHPVGRGKARFLRNHGYTVANQGRLTIALLELAQTEEVSEVVETIYGTKYVIGGMIPAS